MSKTANTLDPDTTFDSSRMIQVFDATTGKLFKIGVPTLASTLISSGPIKEYVDLKSDVNVKEFGAVSDAFESICTVVGNAVTFGSSVLDNSHVGKKIQIYNAGSGVFSFQSTIASVGVDGKTCTLVTAVTNNVSSVPCVIGTNSKIAILNAITFAKNSNLSSIKISGNYLIGGNDGDIVTEHFLLLKHSNFTYNFLGSKIYGNVLLMDDAGYPQINNCTVKNLIIYSLGDGADATSANTNWNGAGIAEGANNTFENITVFANGGTRGFSAQSDNLTGGIKNTQISNFRFTGLYDYEKTDGFDISGINENTIINLQVNNVLITNCGRGFYCNSITANKYFYDISVSNVSVINCYKSALRLFRIKNSTFTNFTLQKTGATTVDAIELNNSKGVRLVGILLENKAVETDFLLSASDCDNSFLDNIKLINSNAAKSPNGILLFSPNMVVNNIFIENVITGLYKGGVISTVNNYSYKNVTDPIRSNTSDANLRLENVTELFSSTLSEKSDLSGFQAVAYCVFDATGTGTLTPIRSKNILSIVKNSTGLFTITFKYTLKEVPVLAGTCRYYGGMKIPFISATPTTSSIVVRVEDLTGTLGDSDYVSLVFF